MAQQKLLLAILVTIIVGIFMVTLISYTGEPYKPHIDNTPYDGTVSGEPSLELIYLKNGISKIKFEGHSYLHGHDASFIHLESCKGDHSE